MSSRLVEPHGGKLVNRVTPSAKSKKAKLAITLTERQQCDFELIAIGAMSPLTGFMGQAAYTSVCEKMLLPDGNVWTIPITCAVDKASADQVGPGDAVQLNDSKGRLLGFLTVEEKYPHDKKLQASRVFKTEDTAHPGVKVLMEEGDICLGGPIEAVTPRHDREFPEYNLTPEQTRAEFVRRGWRTVVAFQTRNPIHRAHEYIQKAALETVDGLLLHPLVGETKGDDLPADVRIASYQAIVAAYYPAARVLLAVYPAAMRYAGPREAIVHAITRKNYGCSHFIVGRDHAGVGNYYGSYDAQHIFDEFSPDEIGITPLFFEHTFYCRCCGGVASTKTCPHDSSAHVALSGTQVRQMLQRGDPLPEEFTRPEVSQILLRAMREYQRT